MSDTGVDTLDGRTLALLVADGVLRVEVEQVRQALEADGAHVHLIARKLGEIHAMDGLDRAGTVPVDRAISDVDAGAYDALVLPGGVAGVDRLRRNPDAIAFIGEMAEARRPIAAIGHAAWLLVEAGVARGRTLTSSLSMRTDVVNAGGTWVDEPVRVDGRVITCRGAADVAGLCEAIAAAFVETPTRVLIVAHRTAATPKLLQAVRERALRSLCEFTLLIPRPYWDPDTEETAATFELVLPLLEEAAGAHVKGALGATDPVEAVREAVAREHFDEAIVSTLPAHVSRWLRLDIPHRVEQLGLPVTVVTAGRSQPPTAPTE